MNHFKDIHIGELIYNKVLDESIEMDRICKFLKSSDSEILLMYKSKSLDSELLLKWSKLLEYDFFRIYTQHLILYAPTKAKIAKEDNVKIPYFRKNIYTVEIIEFILDTIKTGRMTRSEVIDEYKIPKTTLYKWIEKYSN